MGNMILAAVPQRGWVLWMLPLDCSWFSKCRSLTSLAPFCSPLLAPGRHGVSVVVFLAVFRGLSSRSRPMEVLKLGTPGSLLPVTGAEYHALRVHSLSIPCCAQGAEI